MTNKSWDANTSFPTTSRWHWTQEHQVDANLNARPLHRSHERVLWLVAKCGWQTSGLCRFVLFYQICALVQHGAKDVSKTPLYNTNAISLLTHDVIYDTQCNHFFTGAIFFGSACMPHNTHDRHRACSRNLATADEQICISPHYLKTAIVFTQNNWQWVML